MNDCHTEWPVVLLDINRRSINEIRLATGCLKCIKNMIFLINNINDILLPFGRTTHKDGVPVSRENDTIFQQIFS